MKLDFVVFLVGIDFRSQNKNSGRDHFIVDGHV